MEIRFSLTYSMRNLGNLLKSVTTFVYVIMKLIRWKLQILDITTISLIGVFP